MKKEKINTLLDMEKVSHFYIRNVEGKRMGVIVIALDKDVLFFTGSLVSVKDNFSAKKGKAIAYGRMANLENSKTRAFRVAVHNFFSFSYSIELIQVMDFLKLRNVKRAAEARAARMVDNGFNLNKFVLKFLDNSWVKDAKKDIFKNEYLGAYMESEGKETE